MRLSVIIVNYNVRDLLLAAIASVRTSMRGIEGEIIVVDNASTDGAIEAINRQYPEVATVALQENLGFGRANNIGIERARGEYILLLNPDTIVQENTMRVMLDLMDSRPEIGFAGCKVMLPDGTLDMASKRGFPSPWSSFCKVFGLSRLFPKSKIFGGYNLTYLNAGESTVVDALSGCFMFCRTAALKPLGGFDADFFMYGEDLDLCYRARKAGWTIYHTMVTSIVHIKGESSRRGSADALALFYEAMEIFARKHFRRNLPLLLLVRAGILLRRTMARALERFPAWWFVVIDVLAILTGIVIGSILKFGSPFNYPAIGMPLVYVLPPLIFVALIALAGGYGADDRAPNKALIGYLIGFFILSALPYFFKDYAFSRGVTLLTTGTGTLAGVAGRFLWLLYRRTYGRDSIRRIAFFSRREIPPELRNAVRRMFFGRPVAIVGTITPTYSDADNIRGGALGSVEGIAKIIQRHHLSDIFVVDSTLGYGEVLRAMDLVSKRSVRFHIAPGDVAPREDAWTATMPANVFQSRQRRQGSRLRRRWRDGMAAVFVLMFLAPVVYLFSRSPKKRLAELWDVVRGRRALVGGGFTGEIPASLPAVFTAAALCRDETLTRREIANIEGYYAANRSLLLDCEIVIATLRLGRTPSLVNQLAQS